MQMGQQDQSLLRECIQLMDCDWVACAAVFDYGRKKYAEWNWLKGMPWSAVISSCARHLVAMLNDEQNDPESGLSHAGHVMCNLVMLLQYTVSYRAGDDRPTTPDCGKPIHSNRKIADEVIGMVTGWESKPFDAVDYESRRLNALASDAPAEVLIRKGDLVFVGREQITVERDGKIFTRLECVPLPDSNWLKVGAIL